LPLGGPVEEFVSQAGLCGTVGDLARLLDEATRELGFYHFALLHHRSLSGPGAGLVRLDNYPAGWEAELVANGLVGADPVHVASSRTNVGFGWSELPALVTLGPRQCEVLERSRRFGLGEGFTVPVNIPGEPSGSCSFAVRAGAALPARRLLCAEAIGAHAFRAARRIHGYPARRRAPRLSRRERQCMRLVAAGKTDWEIGRILGISAETVHQYVKRARSAYNVSSRTQLALCALRDALISFDDAIPPNG
jgi:LuxR family quorum-sensing system transcriptional regulator CciR